MTFRKLLGSRRRVAWLGAALVVVLAAGVLTAPWPVRLGDSGTGDRDLSARTRDAAGDAPYLGLAVAVVDHGRTRTAGLGGTGTGRDVTPRTPFEIGSVTKTLTASLLADLVRSGVVRADEKVRDVLPRRHWRAGGVGDVTLAELASQRSGLPRVPLSPGTLLHSYGYTLFGLDPYAGASPDEVIAAAADAKLGTRDRFVYSNLGFAFLGQVLAAKTGRPYPELLRERVLRPAGMSHTVVPHGDVGPPAGRTPGHDGIGREVGPWTSAGYAPAGAGVWSTVGDLARFGAAVLHGTAPGADAARPRYPADDGDRIGYAWITSRTRGGGSMTWHNGEAGGCTAFLAFDRGHDRVVAVLGNTGTPVDAIGVRLLLGSGPAASGPPVSPLAWPVGLLFPPVAGVSLLAAALGGYRRRARRVPDRAGLLAAAGWAVFLFAVAYAGGPADRAGAVAWVVGAVPLALGVFAATARWRELRWNDARHPWPHWLGTAVALALGVGLAVGVA